MRDPNRLDNVYTIIKELHKEYFPDLRVMQLINNFYIWHYNKFKSDGFYIEDVEFISKFKNFAREIKGDYIHA